MSLTAMEEAFKKSGLVSEKEIDKREAARKEKEREETKRVTQQEHHRKEEDRHQNIKMNEKFKPFDDRWKDPQKQKFLVHLVFAYTPADTGHYPWTDTELKEKKCCICGQALISKQFIIDNMGKFATISIDHLRRMARGETIPVREEFEKDFGNVVMAVVSPNSSAAFCNPCFEAFYAWIEIMILRGNQQIHRIIQRRRIECSLSEEQLKEHDTIQKEKDKEERNKKLGEFLQRVRKEKENKKGAEDARKGGSPENV